MNKRKRELVLQKAVSERQLAIAQSKNRAEADAGADAGGLPEGWVEQPSSTRSGKIVFVNAHTNEAIAWRPTTPAHQESGHLPPPPAGRAVARRRSKSTKEIQAIAKLKHNSLTKPITASEILKMRGVKREASMPSIKETCGSCVVL